MSNMQTRRDWMKLASVGGVVFASSLVRCARPGSSLPPGAGGAGAPGSGGPPEDFFFLQLSDTHWGFRGPANPESEVMLPRTIEAINAAGPRPDFVMFTGDLTHRADDAATRRRRMAEFKQIAGGLKADAIRFIPGEHDAGADRGEVYREYFGEPRYSFDHKGIHFVALDNVSDPAGAVGQEQIGWLEDDLAKIDEAVPVVVFAHRPLFDLYPQWDWATADGARVISVLSRRRTVTVFYGHVHQEGHRMTGSIAHHSARSLMFALPAPGSAPKRAPVPWDPARPGAGLGYRSIEARRAGGYLVDERSVERKA